MDNTFRVYLFCRHERETFGEVEAHLVAEHRDGAGAGAVGFSRAVLENVSEEVVVGLHRLFLWRQIYGYRHFPVLVYFCGNFFDMKQEDLLKRITTNPAVCGGKPCIRGMRIRVSDVLDLFANGLSAEEVLEELPDLEMLDIQAVHAYVARRFEHPVLSAA